MGNDTLIKDFNDLKNKYEGLFLLNNENKIIGRISFLENISGLLCEYDIEILIPKKYPNKIPTVKEISGKISELFDCNISKDEKILVFNTILKMLSETEVKSTGRKKQYLKMLIYSINDKCNTLKSNLIN